jgi:hypothetical protein
VVGQDSQKSPIVDQSESLVAQFLKCRVGRGKDGGNRIGWNVPLEDLENLLRIVKSDPASSD